MILSKTDQILSTINIHLPHTSLDQYRYEADCIAYNTRKNSSVKTIENLIREYLEENIDEQLIHQVALEIKTVL